MRKVKVFFKTIVFLFKIAFKKKEAETKTQEQIKRLNDAKWSADMKHATTGKRYYVLPVGKDEIKFIVLNADEIKEARRRGLIRKSVYMYEINRLAAYVTP